MEAVGISDFELIFNSEDCELLEFGFDWPEGRLMELQFLVGWYRHDREQFEKHSTLVQVRNQLQQYLKDPLVELPPKAKHMVCSRYGLVTAEGVAGVLNMLSGIPRPQTIQARLRHQFIQDLHGIYLRGTGRTDRYTGCGSNTDGVFFRLCRWCLEKAGDPKTPAALQKQMVEAFRNVKTLP